MIERGLKQNILKSLHKYPVVAILGSRQVGKTTLAKAISSEAGRDTIYLDLELDSDLNKLKEPELYLRQFADTLVVIDEIQRMPGLFPLMRALVDQKRVGGRFLILGSASPDLIRHSSESLAGRIIYHELTPFNLDEVKEDIHALWLRGGYPESYLSVDDNESFVWRESYIQTFLERDIPQLGIHIPAVQLRRFWTMIAHSHGQLWNGSKIASSLGISNVTARRYLDILEDTFLVRQLQPFHSNAKKRTVKSPKVYIRDSGLLHALLHIRSLDGLQGHPAIGSSWEGFVIEQITGLLPEKTEMYFYRTGAGAETDLFFFDKKQSPVGVEIKYSLSPSVTKGFRNACEDLACTRKFVVYPGEEMYPIGNDTYALPVGKLHALQTETSGIHNTVQK
jgi:predicted AAA+ superfamily ATPase